MILIARNELALSDIMLINLLFVNGWYGSLWQMQTGVKLKMVLAGLAPGDLNLDGIFSYLWEPCSVQIQELEQAILLEACHLGSKCCLGKPPPVEGLDPCLAQNGLAQHVTSQWSCAGSCQLRCKHQETPERTAS